MPSRRLWDARTLLTVVGLLLTALTFWSLRRFREYQPLADLGQAASPSSFDGIGLQIRNATVTGRQDGKKRWRVWCRSITLSRDRRQVTVDSVGKGLLYDTSGPAVASIRAGRAVYSTRFGDLMQSGTPTVGQLHLFGGIETHVRVGAGVVLRADALEWDALSNTAECPGTVAAHFPGGDATGQALTLDTKSGDLSLRRLHGTFLIPASVQGLMRPKTSARLVLAMGGGAALATGSAAAPSTPPQQYVTYDSGFSRWLNAPRTVEMSQGVTFTQDDASLKTESAVVNLDDQQRALNAKSKAPVHLYNSQDDLTGRQGYIDFTRHLATLQDNIVLVIKPGAPEKSAPSGSLRSHFQDAATLTCNRMTYDYRRRVGRVPGQLTVHQKDRVLTADSGEYDAHADTVTLVGHVHGHNGPDEIQTSRVIVGLTEGAESITIPVPTHGKWLVKDQVETESAPPAPTSSATLVAPTSSPAMGSLAPNTPPAAPVSKP